ncbi:class I SAM-dependent methyltransferase [Acinetobacter sp. ANC 5378]|uniref:class I SAM-dependent methyltransferase n=1 Tax=Acinetobacter sp. ANC 5378 TaxID=2731249 RepID=UPI00148F916A|nr:class I SAM-dependent methyltransferase [Acinetobacter sp. ANC 5378]NNG82716.1 class I SAM-dependent methyltransferase [Acinetobacter sp. ANC 5378]
MNQTSNYYNQHAQAFFENTYQVEMESLYAPFLRYLPEQASILDLGCGSGRDILAFKKKGYQVEAIDYSAELVKKARELTNIEVRQQSFYDLAENNKYDGIWACASLLHCERDRLTEVLGLIFKALKPNGVCYMSFKYGNTDREKEGCSFTDLNEQQAHDLLKQIDQALLLQQWITVDKRPDRTEEWLNILIRKVQA